MFDGFGDVVFAANSKYMVKIYSRTTSSILFHKNVIRNERGGRPTAGNILNVFQSPVCDPLMALYLIVAPWSEPEMSSAGQHWDDGI